MCTGAGGWDSFDEPKKKPVSEWFGDSDAEYLVIPRSILESLSPKWQRKCVELIEKINSKLPYTVEMEVNGRKYVVSCENDQGEQVHDIYGHFADGRWSEEAIQATIPRRTYSASA
jgi:hypothetical protein